MEVGLHVNPVAPGPIEVKLGLAADAEAAVFSSAFRIGRAPECEVRVLDEYVSRVHAEVTPESAGWRVRDLNSSNGLYWGGNRVENLLVTSTEIVRLASRGLRYGFVSKNNRRQLFSSDRSRFSLIDRNRLFRCNPVPPSLSR